MGNESSIYEKKETDAAGHLSKRNQRNQFESLSVFVNSLEIKAVSARLSHSASSVRRKISNRLSDLHQCHSNDTHDESNEIYEYDHHKHHVDVDDDNDEHDENESTMEDDEWSTSPLSKQKSFNTSQYFIRNEITQEKFSPVLLTSNEHLPNTNIKSFTVTQDNLPRIDENELFNILQGQYTNQFDECLVVDCRFPYEFDGGHICQAINISSQQQLEDRFFNGGESTKKQLLVFHCEYSLLRGPLLATHLRKLDRRINAHRYPILQYPDIVVLEGGYKGFFDKYRHLCYPQNYVAMKDESHKLTCEVEMSKVLQASKPARSKSCNQGPHRRKLDLPRSSSSMASITSPYPTSVNGTSLPRSRRSLKIKKRDRNDTRPGLARNDSRPTLARNDSMPTLARNNSRTNLTRSLQNFSNSCDSPITSPTHFSFEIGDFVPPTAVFRNHSKSSWRSSVTSVDSSVSSVCSELLSPTLSSSESFGESVSPFFDRVDFCENPAVPESDYSSTHASNKGLAFGAFQVNSVEASLENPSEVARPFSARLNSRLIVRPDSSSPNFSSPLTTKSDFSKESTAP